MIKLIKNLSRSKGVRGCNTCYWKRRSWFEKILAHCGIGKRSTIGLHSYCNRAASLQADKKIPALCWLQTSVSPVLAAHLRPEHENVCTNEYKNWLPLNSQERFIYKLKNI